MKFKRLRTGNFTLYMTMIHVIIWISLAAMMVLVVSMFGNELEFITPPILHEFTQKEKVQLLGTALLAFGALAATVTLRSQNNRTQQQQRDIQFDQNNDVIANTLLKTYLMQANFLVGLESIAEKSNHWIEEATNAERKRFEQQKRDGTNRHVDFQDHAIEWANSVSISDEDFVRLDRRIILLKARLRGLRKQYLLLNGSLKASSVFTELIDNNYTFEPIQYLSAWAPDLEIDYNGNLTFGEYIEDIGSAVQKTKFIDFYIARYIEELNPEIDEGVKKLISFGLALSGNGIFEVECEFQFKGEEYISNYVVLNTGLAYLMTLYRALPQDADKMLILYRKYSDGRMTQSISRMFSIFDKLHKSRLHYYNTYKDILNDKKQLAWVSAVRVRDEAYVAIPCEELGKRVFNEVFSKKIK